MEDDRPPHDDPSSMDDPLLEMVLIPPPIHPEDPGPLPGSIVLDPDGYISDRTNDTTAYGFTEAGKRIQVTFWVAHPPRASCFTVYSPDLKPSAFGNSPAILCTEVDLVLLRVPICPPGCDVHPENNAYFVYQAGTKNKPPSLELIPPPPGLLFFSDRDAAVLRCRDREMFFIAVLRWAFAEGQYDLQLYNSKTKTWNSKLMYLKSPKTNKFTCASKVVTIGGEFGSVAWVDLWRGILICDILLDNHHLRYIPLPPPLVPRLLTGPPLLVRDINVLKGCIKYFEMHLYIEPGPVTKGWVAATWRRKVSCTEWEMDCKIKVPKDQTFSEVPPNMQKGEPTAPMLKGVYSGFPALSLHDDDVVYITDKSNLLDKRATVIAVNMRKQTLEGTAEFGPGRPLGYSFIYFQSGISKYLGLWTSTR